MASADLFKADFDFIADEPENKPLYSHSAKTSLIKCTTDHAL
jgi:hypothetical protein